MSRVPTPTRLTILGDLHISAGPGDAFVEDRALVRFLQDMADRDDPQRRALLFLGDLFDFSKLRIRGRLRLDRSEQAATAKLELAAAHHGEAFGALGRLAAAGVALEIVVGNHDAELVRPAVRRRLAELLAGAAGQSSGDCIAPRVHPWFLHVPGAIHAEHGQQHHEINRIPELLDPRAIQRGGRISTPLGVQLAYLLAEQEELRSRPLRRAAALVRRTGPGGAAGVRMLRRGRFDSGSTSLPASTATKLAALTTPSLTKLARRVARRGDPDRYMVDAAERIDHVLSSAGAATPFYVFGHTHIAADRPLSLGARYLSPGSWSTYRPRGSPLHFVEVDLEGDAPRATLLEWRGARAHPGASPAFTLPR